MSVYHAMANSTLSENNGNVYLLNCSITEKTHAELWNLEQGYCVCNGNLMTQLKFDHTLLKPLPLLVSLCYHIHIRSFHTHTHIQLLFNTQLMRAFAV